MQNWFNTWPKWLKIILLIIPGINWIIEVIIRWEEFTLLTDFAHFAIALISTIGFGIFFGWIDAFGIGFTNQMFFIR